MQGMQSGHPPAGCRSPPAGSVAASGRPGPRDPGGDGPVSGKYRFWTPIIPCPGTDAGRHRTTRLSLRGRFPASVLSIPTGFRNRSLSRVPQPGRPRRPAPADHRRHRRDAGNGPAGPKSAEVRPFRWEGYFHRTRRTGSLAGQPEALPCLLAPLEDKGCRSDIGATGRHPGAEVPHLHRLSRIRRFRWVITHAPTLRHDSPGRGWLPPRQPAGPDPRAHVDS